MYCPNCGGECYDGHRFCFRCGAPLPPADTEMEEKGQEICPTETAAPSSQSLEPVQTKSSPVAPVQASPIPTPPRKGRLWPPMLLMALMIALGLLVFFVTSGSSGKDPAVPWFQVESGTLYFNPALYSGSSELTVPEVIGGQTVTALSEGCFAECNRLTTVILPDTLTEIGSWAFAECSSLRGVFIPESVRTIGDQAFYCCTSLEAVCISGTVSSIGQQAFLLCPKLHHVFFTGSYQKWTTLYTDPIASDTMVYCIDGAYRHTSRP